MALRNVVKEPDELLRKVCKPVDHIDKRLTDLLDDMAQTMYKNDGVGLAAPQVGILRRAVVIDTQEEDGLGLIELINPKIILQEGEQINEEGCLSVVGRRGCVKRPKKVKVEAYDRNGDLLEYTAEGLLAVVMCHEIDHLDGILYIDKLIDKGQK